MNKQKLLLIFLLLLSVNIFANDNEEEKRYDIQIENNENKSKSKKEIIDFYINKFNNEKENETKNNDKNIETKKEKVVEENNDNNKIETKTEVKIEEKKEEKIEKKENINNKSTKDKQLEKQKELEAKKEENRKNAIKPIEKEIEEEIVEKVPYNDIVYSVRYGKVLSSTNADKIHSLASLTKVMTALVTIDEINKGNFSYDDVITVKSQYANIGGSWLNTRAGVKYTLYELLEILLVYSANNSAYMIADYISNGNIDLFVEKMNKKAKELGMTNTKYYTPAGLPTSFTNKPLDVSTVTDQLKLALEIINTKELLEISSKDDVIMNNGSADVLYQNRNPLIKNRKLLNDNNIYPLGLKTGYHSLAGYNMIGISNINDNLYVYVTFGNKSENERYLNQKNKMIELKENEELFISKDNLFQVSIGDKFIEVYILENFYSIKGLPLDIKYEINDDLKKIKKDDVIGKINVYSDNRVIKSIDIYSNEDVNLKNTNFIYILLPIIVILFVFAIIIKILKNRKRKVKRRK